MSEIYCGDCDFEIAYCDCTASRFRTARAWAARWKRAAKLARRHELLGDRCITELQRDLAATRRDYDAVVDERDELQSRYTQRGEDLDEALEHADDLREQRAILKAEIAAVWADDGPYAELQHERDAWKKALELVASEEHRAKKELRDELTDLAAARRDYDELVDVLAGEQRHAHADLAASRAEAAKLREALELVESECRDGFIVCDRCSHENAMSDLDIVSDIKTALGPVLARGGVWHVGDIAACRAALAGADPAPKQEEWINPLGPKPICTDCGRDHSPLKPAPKIPEPKEETLCGDYGHEYEHHFYDAQPYVLGLYGAATPPPEPQAEKKMEDMLCSECRPAIKTAGWLSPAEAEELRRKLAVAIEQRDRAQAAAVRWDNEQRARADKATRAAKEDAVALNRTLAVNERLRAERDALKEKVLQHARSFDGHVYVKNEEYSELCEARRERAALKAELEEFEADPDCSRAEHGGHPTCVHMEEVRASLRADLERAQAECHRTDAELVKAMNARDALADEVRTLKAQRENVEAAYLKAQAANAAMREELNRVLHDYTHADDGDRLLAVINASDAGRGFVRAERLEEVRDALRDDAWDQERAKARDILDDLLGATGNSGGKA